MDDNNTSNRMKEKEYDETEILSRIDLLEENVCTLRNQMAEMIKEKQEQTDNILSMERNLFHYKSEYKKIKRSTKYKVGNAIAKIVKKPYLVFYYIFILIKMIFKTIFLKNTKINNKRMNIKYKEYMQIGDVSKAKKIILKQIKHSSSVPILKLRLEIVNNILEMLGTNDVYKYLNNNIKTYITSEKYIPEKNKILHVLNSCGPYNVNGYAVRFDHIASTLRDMGYKQAVVLKPGFPNNLGYEKSSKKDFICEITNDINHYYNNYRIKQGATPFNKYIKLFVESIINVALIEKPEILHAASNYSIGVATAIAADILNIPFIYEVRGRWELTKSSTVLEYRNSDEFKFSQKMEAYVMEKADKVVTLSNALKDFLVLEGTNPEKIIVVPNCVNTNDINEVEYDSSLAEANDLLDKFVIGYAGAIIKPEGLQTAIKAVKILVEKGMQNINFVILGAGKYKDELEKLVTKNNLKEFVFFLGKVSKADVMKYYSIFDICVLPREDVEVCRYVPPIKPFECMAMGKPVITSDLPVFREFINEENGRIFKGSERELADIIEHFANNPSETKKLGVRAKEWIYNKHNHTIIYSRYKKIYDNIIN